MNTITRMVPRLLFLFIIALAALSGGCGGGGGSAGFSAPPVAITNSNAPQIAAQTVNLGGTVSSPVAGQGGKATASSLGPKVHGLNIAIRVMDQFDRLSGKNGERQIQSFGVSMTTIFPCTNGGSYTIDNNAINFTNCVETPGETINGAMSFSGLTGNGSPGSPPWNASGRLEFSNFSLVSDHAYLMNGVGNFTLGSPDGIWENLTISNGTFTVSLDGKSNTLSGYSVDFSENNQSLDYALSMNGTMSSNLLNGSVTFTTLTQFTGVDIDNNDPDSGKMKIIGANNSSATLTAIGNGQVTLEVDADGDGVVDANGTDTIAWSALDATL